MKSPFDSSRHAHWVVLVLVSSSLLLGCVADMADTPGTSDKGFVRPDDLEAGTVVITTCRATRLRIACGGMPDVRPFRSGTPGFAFVKLVAAGAYATDWQRLRGSGLTFDLSGLSYPLEIRAKGGVYLPADGDSVLEMPEVTSVIELPSEEETTIVALSGIVRRWPIHVVLADAADQEEQDLVIEVPRPNTTAVRMNRKVPRTGGLVMDLGVYPELGLTLYGGNDQTGLSVEGPGSYVLHGDGTVTPATEAGFEL